MEGFTLDTLTVMTNKKSLDMFIVLKLFFIYYEEISKLSNLNHTIVSQSGPI